MCSQHLDLQSASMPQKNFKSLDTRARNLKHLEDMSCFAPIKDFLILTLSYLELGPHLANLDHTPSNHNPDHAQGPKWAPVTVDRPTHWAPSARVHHPCNTWYLILEVTQTRADYCMTHSCNYAQLEVRPIKIISSLANTSLLMLLL